jgi:hypothetical protein
MTSEDARVEELAEGADGRGQTTHKTLHPARPLQAGRHLLQPHGLVSNKLNIACHCPARPALGQQLTLIDTTLPAWRMLARTCRCHT